ncbi:MAG: DUF1566 domain-containing protein, partial [Myxococcaceae bacterium]
MKVWVVISILGLMQTLFAERILIRNISEPALNWIWKGLATVAKQDSGHLIKSSQECMEDLLLFMAPNIQNMSNYAGQFAGNCTVFFDQNIEQVDCDFISRNVSLKNNRASWLPPIRLPIEYGEQIPLSHILMSQIAADWQVGKYQQQINHLWLRQNPCTKTASPSQSLAFLATKTDLATISNTDIQTQTQQETLSKTEEQTPSWLNTFSKTLFATKSAFESWTGSESLSSTRTESNTKTVSLSSTKSSTHTLSKTDSNSISRSLSSTGTATASINPTRSSSVSDDKTISKSLSNSETSSLPVVWNPEWANWDVTTGVYKDATNQTGRYNESVPGIVTDLMTGLQWQKATAPGIYNWTNASTYCDNLVLGGFSDWRLPTRIELQSLVDYTISYQSSNPAIKNDVFLDTPKDYFWSSTPVADNSSIGWYVNFGTSGANTYAGLICYQSERGCNSSSAQGYLRCARPQTATFLEDRYRDENGNILINGSLQVKDRVTGLIWQRVTSGTGYTWSATNAPGSAQAYCSNLVIGTQGAGSWRLPNIKELETLTTTAMSNSSLATINSTAFPLAPSVAFWSSSSVAGTSPSLPLYVPFDRGGVYFSSDANPFYARCVRSANLISNPQWANWDQSTGVYQDSTNQTDRYIEPRPEVVKDTLTGLQWQKSTAPGTYNWTAAKAYCDNLFLSGYGDWRLPTTVELQSLVDYTKNCSGPAINAVSFPNTGINTSFYWSSDPVAGNSGYYWWANFGDAPYRSYGNLAKGSICNHVGSCGQYTPSNGLVRCVRPLASKGLIDRYRDQFGIVLVPGSTEVMDLKTGLIWQRFTSGTYNLSSAKNYCNQLSLDGYSWRLPIAKEMYTLLDISISYPGPSINSTAFPATPTDLCWTFSINSCNSSSGILVGFNGGSVVNLAIDQLFSVRCVRNPSLPTAISSCAANAVIPLTNGLLTAWNGSNGVYADGTNQTGRYVISTGVVFDTLTNILWQQYPSTTTMNFT